MTSVFRLPDTAHVGGVRLQVGDLERSIAFYEHVLGLSLLRAEGSTAELGVRASEPPPVTLVTRPGVRPARRGAFGLYHFALRLPDRASLGRFATRLPSLGVRAGSADHLVSEAIYFHDPDGLGIEVYADRPAAKWRRRGNGEIVMSTDPLDMASLVAESGAEEWQGAPPGTAVGHIHLHVGSLDSGEAFYHRALGFDKTAWNYPGALFMSAGGYHHHLGINVWAPGPSPAPDEAQLLEWSLVVPTSEDVASAAASLRAAGYEPEHGPDGLLAADPWGTRVRVRANE